MNIKRHLGESFKSSRSRTSRGQRRFKVADYQFWSKCLTLMITYESLQEKYKTLGQDHCASVISESAYMEGFGEIVNQVKILIGDYGRNISHFLNSGLGKHTGNTKDKIKGIVDLYLLMQKKYILMVRLYNLSLFTYSTSGAPFRFETDSTLLVNVSDISIQNYMKIKK